MKVLPRHRFTLLVLALFLFPPLALAHPGHATVSFAGGISHPFTGLDHVLAMVSVGLFAIQRGGRATWGLPVTFLGTMMLGGALSFGAMDLPAVELMILLSVVMLGGMVAFQKKIPTAAATLLIGLFALFHGHAHLSEMGPLQSFGPYTLGFLLSTGLLHAVGLLLGVALLRNKETSLGQTWHRLGITVSALGLLMMVGWL